MNGLILGAYAAAPSALHEDQGAERAWYEHLRREPLVGGLELAWDGALHPLGIDRLLPLLEPRWSSVVTLMPRISTRLLVDPAYGLASDVPSSRAAAIEDLDRVHADVAAIRAALGPHAVHTVQLQSAPGPRASTAALTASLEHALSLDWDGVRIVIEHCDARTGPAPQKGFLPLEDEQSALEAARESTDAPTSTGHTINWARSVIEEHDARVPARQLARLGASGVATGVMFSGVAPVPTIFGGAWTDTHLPVAADGGGAEPASLLTSERIREAISAVGTLAYLGAKVSAPKRDRVELTERLEPGFTTLRAIAEVVRA